MKNIKKESSAVTKTVAAVSLTALLSACGGSGSSKTNGQPEGDIKPEATTTDVTIDEPSAEFPDGAINEPANDDGLDEGSEVSDIVNDGTTDSGQTTGEEPSSGESIDTVESDSEESADEELIVDELDEPTAVDNSELDENAGEIDEPDDTATASDPELDDSVEPIGDGGASVEDSEPDENTGGIGGLQPTVTDGPPEILVFFGAQQPDLTQDNSNKIWSFRDGAVPPEGTHNIAGLRMDETTSIPTGAHFIINSNADNTPLEGGEKPFVVDIATNDVYDLVLEMRAKGDANFPNGANGSVTIEMLNGIFSARDLMRRLRIENYIPAFGDPLPVHADLDEVGAGSTLNNSGFVFVSSLNPLVSGFNPLANAFSVGSNVETLIVRSGDISLCAPENEAYREFFEQGFVNTDVVTNFNEIAGTISIEDFLRYTDAQREGLLEEIRYANGSCIAPGSILSAGPQ